MTNQNKSVNILLIDYLVMYSHTEKSETYLLKFERKNDYLSVIKTDSKVIISNTIIVEVFSSFSRYV